MGYCHLAARETKAAGWVVDSADYGDVPAQNLTERHAKELAKRINELLEMAEEQLCPPVCNRCGSSGIMLRDFYVTVERIGRSDYRLCNDCCSAAVAELAKHKT